MKLRKLDKKFTPCNLLLLFLVWSLMLSYLSSCVTSSLDRISQESQFESSANWCKKCHIKKITSPAKGVYVIFAVYECMDCVVLSHYDPDIPMQNATKIKKGRRYDLDLEWVDKDLTMEINDENDRQHLYAVIDSIGGRPEDILLAERLEIPFTIRYVHENLNDPVYEYHGVRLWLKEKEEYWHLYIAKNLNGLFLVK